MYMRVLLPFIHPSRSFSTSPNPACFPARRHNATVTVPALWPDTLLLPDSNLLVHLLRGAPSSLRPCLSWLRPPSPGLAAEKHAYK